MSLYYYKYIERLMRSSILFLFKICMIYSMGYNPLRSVFIWVLKLSQVFSLQGEKRVTYSRHKRHQLIKRILVMGQSRSSREAVLRIHHFSGVSANNV